MQRKEHLFPKPIVVDFPTPPFPDVTTIMFYTLSTSSLLAIGGPLTLMAITCVTILHPIVNGKCKLGTYVLHLLIGHVVVFANL
jgi:hypothetical protein